MLGSLTAINAILFTGAVVALLREWRRRKSSAFMPMMLWFAHCALYWTTITVARWFFDYTGPSQFVTTWGAIVQMQAAITVIAVMAGEYVLRRSASNGQ